VVGDSELVRPIGEAVGFAAFLFLVFLPPGLFFWAIAFAAAGRVSDPTSMPGGFRAAYRFAYPHGADSPAIHVVGPVAVLVLLNVMVGPALQSRFGMLVAGETMVYLAAQGFWVRRLWRASA
jgi:hypothetical protein